MHARAARGVDYLRSAGATQEGSQGIMADVEQPVAAMVVGGELVVGDAVRLPFDGLEDGTHHREIVLSEFRLPFVEHGEDGPTERDIRWLPAGDPRAQPVVEFPCREVDHPMKTRPDLIYVG